MDELNGLLLTSLADVVKIFKEQQPSISYLSEHPNTSFAMILMPRNPMQAWRALKFLPLRVT